MRTLRRRIRNFFALQAILLFLTGLRGLLDHRYPQEGVSPLRHWIFLSSYLLLSLVFTKAWRTTRKPSEVRNAWGTAASLLSVAAGVYLLLLDHSSVARAAPGLVALLIGVSSWIICGRGGAAPDARVSGVPEPEAAAGPFACGSTAVSSGPAAQLKGRFRGINR